MKKAKPGDGRTHAPGAAKPAAASGYSDIARTAVQGTTARVQEMHRAIADQSFAAVGGVPLLAGPARLAQMLHDTIAGGVYAAIHHGAGGVFAATAAIERQLPNEPGDGPPNRSASSLRSALNAAFGDHLADTGNVLAIDMALHVDGRAVPLETAALAAAYPDGGRRLCLFIHGLAFDEHCWQPGSPGDIDFGRQLRADFGHAPLYLRYNTGLAIADNGARLADLLERLLAAWPERIDELLLIGHSMGGLIARNACEQAAARDCEWPRRTRLLVCLGSPHLGSPVERLGHAINSALQQHAITAPLGRIAAARSRGVKDLRHGPGAAAATPHGIALRFLGSSLTEDVDHPLAEWFGDGLVTLGSATEHPLDGDVQSVRLGGIAHMALLTEPRVYAQIARWLGELGDA